VYWQSGKADFDMVKGEIAAGETCGVKRFANGFYHIL
jgi:hypothetical protein